MIDMPSMTRLNERLLLSKATTKRTRVFGDMSSNSERFFPSPATTIMCFNLLFLVISPLVTEAGVITKTESINSPHEHKLSEKEHYG